MINSKQKTDDTEEQIQRLINLEGRKRLDFSVVQICQSERKGQQSFLSLLKDSFSLKRAALNEMLP